jgi:hypothetical protein
VEVTRTALNSGDPDVIPSFCDFMAVQRYTKDAENLRNGSPDEARRMLNVILDATLDGRAVFVP